MSIEDPDRIKEQIPNESPVDSMVKRKSKHAQRKMQDRKLRALLTDRE
jgi:hypothetical protein